MAGASVDQLLELEHQNRALAGELATARAIIERAQRTVDEHRECRSSCDLVLALEEILS